MERDKIMQKYILITSMNFPSGGAGATYLNLFCRGLKMNGCPISVILLKGYAFGDFMYNGSRKKITSDGIHYTHMGFKQRPVNQLLKIFDELISLSRLVIFLFSLISKRKSIRLLIFNSELQFNIPIHLMAKIFQIRTSQFVAEYIDKSEFSNTFFGRMKRLGYLLNFKYLNKKSDSLIVFSYFLKNEYIMMGFDETKIIVQPNLTDFEYWESAKTEIEYTLGYSGAPYLKDGLFDLFKAISLLNNENIKVTLLVIGDATFGKSLIPALKVECERFGISDQVTFTGLVELSSVKQYLSECNILTITRSATTQTLAGFPTKLGEYFASKKPVLATNFGDMGKYFIDGQEIILAECGNPESIAQKIKWMLNNSKELELISRRGYDKAIRLLGYKDSVNKIINFLQCKSS